VEEKGRSKSLISARPSSIGLVDEERREHNRHET